MGVRYLTLDDYDNFLSDLITDESDFEAHRTNYTRKIKVEESTYIFNEDGRNDFEILSLINRVRRDSQKYFEENKETIYADLKEATIEYFDLIEKPPFEHILVAKVDINGAYWNYALKQGIISQETDDFLHREYGGTKGMKRARLKALGSLATRKIIDVYEDGIIKHTRLKKQDTYDLYIYINKGINDLMTEACEENEGSFFYYVDCIFTRKDCSKELVDWIAKKDYHTTVDETYISTETVLNRKYLVSKDNYSVSNSSDKMYVVRPESEWILNS